MKSVYKHLTERSAPITKKELVDNEELMKAVYTDNVDKVKEEFKNVPNSNPNMKDSQGRTLLYGCRHSEIAKILIDKGAELENTDNNQGETPLAHASYYHREKVMEVLLKAGANPNCTYDPKNRQKDNDSGMTPLHFMASYDKLDMVQLLVKKGADINATDDLKITPLMVCFMGKSLAKKTAKFLIEKGADINATDHLGQTALTYAFARTKDKNVLYMLQG